MVAAMLNLFALEGIRQQLRLPVRSAFYKQIRRVTLSWRGNFEHLHCFKAHIEFDEESAILL